MIDNKPLSSPLGASLSPPSQTSVLSDSSHSTGTPSEKCHPPPWQVKWKRPRLDRVVFGIDVPGDDDECACDDFSESERDDWIPISSSSVVLTRDEARKAIFELHKRDELLVKKIRKKQVIDKSRGGILQKCDHFATSTTTPTKGENKNKIENLSEKTPRNSNVKKSPVISPSTIFSISSWFQKSTEDPTLQSSPGKQSKESKPPLSGPTNKSNAKPPRFQRSRNKIEHNLLSPPSSALFTTFSNVTTPPPKSSSRHSHSPQEEEGPSPPTITDASTASSLLWEDNTLTSVSDEDAVAFRMYENTKLRQSGGAGVPALSMSKSDADDHAFSTIEGGQVHRSRDEDDEDDIFYGGRYYCDGHGNLRRLSEWDGFDNVVLSVTVYAVASCKSTTFENIIDPINQDGPPTSGEVVVIELLSTKNPPYLESFDARPGKLKKVSLSALPQTNTRPPPSPSRKSCSISKEESDATVISAASNSEQQQLIDEDAEEETSSNHPRILARRVVRWPSSIMSLDSKKQSSPTRNLGKLYLNCTGCPSFVSLGRKNVWDGKTVDEKLHSCDNGNDVVYCTDQGERAADAIDAIRSLDFLLGDCDNMKPASRPTSLSSKDTACEDDSSAKKYSSAKEVKTKQPLCLCFVTNDGYVHFFDAMRVFLSRNAISKDDRNISNSFAALLFGDELLRKVLDDVMPLSHPHVSLKLSQVSCSRVDGNIDTDVAIWNAFFSVPRRTNTADVQTVDIAQGEAEMRNNDWALLFDFDACVDPMSLRYRTLPQSNFATGACITSNPDNGFLAICGKGLRRLAPRNGCPPVFTLGGFITFISLHHCSEVKSIYVPFAIDRVQPVCWNGFHFVILLGDEGFLDQRLRLDGHRPFAMAIRVDSKRQHTIMPGESRCNSLPDRFQPVMISLSSLSASLGSQSRALFQEGDTIGFNTIRCKAMSISAIPSSPPGIVTLVHSTLPNASHVVEVVNHTLSSFHDGVFSTVVRPGHRLRLDQTNLERNDAACHGRDIWCTGGQGWSLVGFQGNLNALYYISWDGSTDSQGPYLLRLTGIDSTDNQAKTTTQPPRTLISCVMPLMSFVTCAESVLRSATSKESQKITAPLPFTSTYTFSSFLRTEQGRKFPEDHFSKLSCSEALRESLISTARNEGGIDDVLISALGSISNNYKSLEDTAKPYRSNALLMSHEQKSKRLLQHCSSWTQLDDTRANRGIVHGQVLSTIMRVGSYTQALTLRTNTAMNPLTTPFDQVLSWLCQRRDYFTAASVALSLLDDAEAVYELRGISKDRNGQQIAHQGLLDSISPLTNAGASDDAMHTKTLTSLADMTVGCLIKGGVSMATTLEGFLTRNKLYDSSRASIMLVGTFALVISSESSLGVPSGRIENMNIVECLSKTESPGEAAIWPIKCLLTMAVARNCLSSALLMLNATIPNELRWRSPQVRGFAAAHRPPLGLFLALVDTILESTPEATRSFLDLVDEESGLTYWSSIEDDTRLALSLFSVGGKHIMIQQPEVRHWILDRLKKEIESPFHRAFDDSYLPNEWLREIIIGALCNAECDICLGLEAMRKTKAELNVCSEGDFQCYRDDRMVVRDLLIPHTESGGLDFDILIPSLLLLSLRGCHWREGSSIRTQILLNTVCDLAGRKTSCTPMFLFDGRAVMRQCALAGNVQATAFLIGGRNGLVLECADLLITQIGVSMKEAEIALFGGSLAELKELKLSWEQKHSADNSTQLWCPTRSHHHILWLIEYHVLNVRNYGEFDSPATQGQATPVTAGRICFRAWYCLTSPDDSNAAAKWLEIWLRHKLDLQDGISPRRLPCAALVRVLLWADEECSVLDLHDSEDDQVLGVIVGLDVRFMAELSHACIGLIFSIPPSLQSDILNSLGNSNRSAIFSFEVEGHHSVIPFNGVVESKSGNQDNKV